MKGVNAETDRVEDIDVLRDLFITTRQIVRVSGRVRALDPTAAFDAVEEAYDELKDELESAAGVSV